MISLKTLRLQQLFATLGTGSSGKFGLHLRAYPFLLVLLALCSSPVTSGKCAMVNPGDMTLISSFLGSTLRNLLMYGGQSFVYT